MRIPKRLPEGLKALVELEEAFGRLTLLSAEMRRYQGAAHIELTYIDKDSFSGDALVTIDSALSYNKYERKVKEQAQAHRRNINVFRKAVLAS